MPQYLVAIQHPENYDPSLEGEAMIRRVAQVGAPILGANPIDFAQGRLWDQRCRFRAACRLLLPIPRRSV